MHAPSLEKEYIEKGVLVNGSIFAYNYFVIAGPREDPANISRAVNAVDAFKRIYEAGERGIAIFVSRGDRSGTHIRELLIWREAGLDPRDKIWYIEAGAGMAETLLLANEKRAYVLSDIGTFLKLKRDGRIPELEILYTNSTELINIYSVYLVKTCSGSERRAAIMFMEFLLGEGQELIGKYGVDLYGQPLFYPARNKTDYLRSIWNILAEK